MIIKDWKKEILTIPNLLSFFRLILIPVYMAIYLNAQETRDYITAGTILAISCATDAVDGKIARTFNMITTFGKFLDPLADKLTQFSLIICLALKHPVLHTMIVLFVVKEVFQLIAGLLTLRKGKMLTGALITGKVCTTVLFVSLILMVLLPDMDPHAIKTITLVDCIFLLISFADYARMYFTHGSKIQDIPSSNSEE